MSRRRVSLSMYLSLTVAAMTAMVQGGEAAAQDYPSKVVRIIVPAGPGGTSDIVARLVAPGLTAALNQQFIVDNRGGGAGLIGTQQVAQSPPDGYTLLVTFDSFGVNPLLLKLPYDTVKDFAPVMQISHYSYAMYVHSSLGVKTVKEFVALAKQKQAAHKLNFGSPGPASSTRLAFELFKDVAGIEMPTIPYKGGGGSRLALISGEVQVTFASLGGIMQQNVENGKLTLLGVTTLTRSPMYPDVPTIAETYPGYETQSWAGMFAPAGTPRPVINKLHATLTKFLAEPDTKERFQTLAGSEIVAGTPEALARLLRDDLAKWGNLIRKRKITID